MHLIRFFFPEVLSYPISSQVIIANSKRQTDKDVPFSTQHNSQNANVIQDVTSPFSTGKPQRRTSKEF